MSFTEANIRWLQHSSPYALQPLFDDQMTNHFNQVEELVGTYPSRDELRNAIFALVENDCPLTAWELLDAEADLMTEVMAREYEVRRGIHMHIGGVRQN
tara:strand:+ start:102 stop:398 length:297 start_codon:yes stop_codon:yes gene_type:complete